MDPLAFVYRLVRRQGLMEGLGRGDFYKEHKQTIGEVADCLNSVYTAQGVLHPFSPQVKTNPRRSATLDQRVQAIIPHVKALDVQLA